MTDFLPLTSLNLICAEIIGRHTKNNITPNQTGIDAVLPDGSVFEFRGSVSYLDLDHKIQPGIYRKVYSDGPAGFARWNYPLEAHQLPEIIKELSDLGYITLNDLPSIDELAKRFSKYKHSPKNTRYCPFWIGFESLTPDESHSDYNGIINVQDINGQLHKIHYKAAIDNKDQYRLWHPAYEGNNPCPPEQ